MSSPTTGAYREFKVVFEGVELPPDAADRIDQAIQNAVKEELARSQIATTSVRPLRDELSEQEIVREDMRTEGIYVR